jgi:hypothetical protein
MRAPSLVLFAVFCAVASPGLAQNSTPQILTNQPSLTYDVKNMTFDRWCQETQQYPADRCDKRQPADVKAFEDYRDAVERYELQYLKEVDQRRAAEQRNNIDPTQTERTIQDAPVQ